MFKSPEILRSKGMKTPDNETSLRNIEYKGAGTPSRNEPRPYAIDEFNGDFLSDHDAEEQDVDKNKNSESIIINDGFKNIAVVPTNNFSDTGVELFDDDDEDESEPEAPEILKTTTTPEFAANSVAQEVRDQGLIDHYNELYGGYDGEDDEDVVKEANNFSNQAETSSQWRDHIPEHPVDSYIWQPSITDYEIHGEKLEEELIPVKISDEQQSILSKEQKQTNHDHLPQYGTKKLFKSNYANDRETIRRVYEDVNNQSDFSKVDVQNIPTGEVLDSLTKPDLIDDHDIRRHFEQHA